MRWDLRVCTRGLGLLSIAASVEHPGAERLLPMAHYGTGSRLFTIAIPLSLHEHWITLAWLMEGALASGSEPPGAPPGEVVCRPRCLFSGCCDCSRSICTTGACSRPIFNPRLGDLCRRHRRAAMDDLSRLPFAGCSRIRLWDAMAGRSGRCESCWRCSPAGLEIHDTFAALIRATVVDPRNPSIYDVRTARHGLRSSAISPTRRCSCCMARG